MVPSCYGYMMHQECLEFSPASEVQLRGFTCSNAALPLQLLLQTSTTWNARDSALLVQGAH